MTTGSHKQSPSGKKLPWFERFAHAVTVASGSSPAFGLALTTIIVWLLSGPLFHFSDTWQLVINTGTTIITFLMVFLIQRSQNKDSLAIQLKLNELVAAIEGANNHLIGAEDFSEDELQVLHRHYSKLAAMSRQEADVGSSLSVEEAKVRHERKRKHRHAQKNA